MAATKPQDKDIYSSILEDNMYIEATMAESITELKTKLTETKETLADTIDVLDNFLFGTMGLIVIIVLLGIGILYLLHRQIIIIRHFKTKECHHDDRLENTLLGQKVDLHQRYRNNKENGKVCLKTINEISHVNGDLQSHQIFNSNDRNGTDSKYNHLYEECNRSASYYDIKPSFQPNVQQRTVRSPVSPSGSITIENVSPKTNTRKSQLEEHSLKKNNNSENGSYQTFSIDTEESFYDTPSIRHSDRSSKYMSTSGLKEKKSEDVKTEETKEMVVEPFCNEEEETYDLPRPITEDKCNGDDFLPPPEHLYSSDTYENITDFETYSRF